MESTQSSQMPKFNLAKFIKLCFKNWVAFGICIIACLALTCFYILIRKPAYEVDAQLMLPPETSSGSSFILGDLASSFSLGDMFGGSSTENEVAVMRSHTVFLNTVKDLGLNTGYFEKAGFMKWLPAYEKRQLQLTPEFEIADTLSMPILFKINLKDNGKFDINAKVKKRTVSKVSNVDLPYLIETPYGNFNLEKTSNFGITKFKKFKITFSSYSATADAYSELVKIYAPNKKTDFIALSFIAMDPAFGELLLNTIIDNYNLMGNSQKNDKDNRTLSFLNERIAALEANLTISEDNILNFKQKNKITDVEIDVEALMKKTGSLQNTILYSESELEIIKIAKDFISKPENKYSLIPNISTGSQDSQIESAATSINAFNNLILERMKIASSAKSNNPYLVQLDEQIDAMRANIVSSVDRAYINAEARLKELYKENNQTQSKLNTIPSLEKEYIGLERTNMLQQQLYLFLLKQREETSMSLAKTNPTLITIDAPYTLSEGPGLTSKKLLALAILIGGLIGLLYVFYFKLKKAPITSKDELESITDIPIIGDIKYSHDLCLGNNSEAESIRMLKTNLMFILNEIPGKNILVTSYEDQGCSTFTAYNLAASLCMQQNKVLLIDTTSENKVNSYIDIQNAQSGIVDLENNNTIEPTRVALNAQSIWVLPAGNSNVNISDILASPKFKKFISTIKDEFDYVVINSAKLDGLSDTYALADYADITLCCIRSGIATPSTISSLNEIYKAARLKRIALTFIS